MLCSVLLICNLHVSMCIRLIQNHRMREYYPSLCLYMTAVDSLCSVYLAVLDLSILRNELYIAIWNRYGAFCVQYSVNVYQNPFRSRSIKRVSAHICRFFFWSFNSIALLYDEILCDIFRNKLCIWNISKFEVKLENYLMVQCPLFPCFFSSLFE